MTNDTKPAGSGSDFFATADSEQRNVDLIETFNWRFFDFLADAWAPGAAVAVAVWMVPAAARAKSADRTIAARVSLDFKIKSPCTFSGPRKDPPMTAPLCSHANLPTRAGRGRCAPPAGQRTDFRYGRGSIGWPPVCHGPTQYSKCRWQPTASPVSPTRPIVRPAS